jgi:hypothetical protein
MPTKAQIIQEGKYEPKILRDGAPSQPLNKHSIGPAPLNPAMGRYRFTAASRQNRTAWCVNVARLRAPEKAERLCAQNRLRTAICIQLDEDALDGRLNRFGRNTDLASNLFI